VQHVVDDVQQGVQSFRTKFSASIEPSSSEIPAGTGEHLLYKSQREREMAAELADEIAELDEGVIKKKANSSFFIVLGTYRSTKVERDILPQFVFFGKNEQCHLR